MKYLGAFFAAFLVTSAAHAAITVEQHTLIKDILQRSSCTKDPETCLLSMEITYPIIHGMIDEKAQSALNANFAEYAKNLTKNKGFQGTPISKYKEDEFAKEGINPSRNEFSYTYEITYQSSELLGLEFTQWVCCGAHGTATVTGKIFDLNKGKELTVREVFDLKKLAGVNQVIYDTLSDILDGNYLSFKKVRKKHIGINGDYKKELEKLKGSFITWLGCKYCSLELHPDGVHVVFESYSVAPYPAGNPDVPIPLEYIGYPALRKALTEKKP